jgi:transposase InsO family protein
MANGGAAFPGQGKPRDEEMASPKRCNPSAGFGLEGWLYLCVVVDLYSGGIVGWSMSARQDRQLVLQAVLMALWQRQNRSPVVLHSDRGCRFTSDEYQRFLKGHQLLSSKSAGRCLRLHRTSSQSKKSEKS